MNRQKTALSLLLVSILFFPACTTPSWALEAEKIAEVALPIVEGIATIVGAGPAVSKAETDINLLISLFDQYQATPAAGTLQQIQAGLNTANADIAQIMPAAGIKDSSTQNKVAAVLQLLTSEFSNIATLIPANAAPVAGGANSSQPTAHSNALPGMAGSIQGPAHTSAAPKATLPLSAKDFKKKYNAIVNGDSHFKKL